MRVKDLHLFTHFMMNSNLINQINKTIKDFSIPLWFPDLTNELVNIGEKIIKEDFGLTLSEYRTNIVWHKNKNIPRNIVTEISNPFSNDSNTIQVEILDSEIISSYKESQIGFYDADEIINGSINNCITEAIDYIKLVPSLLRSIFTLVRSLHLIKLEDNAYDVSFSEPHIPFSIFISVPNKRLTADYLRVAEAIIHEAMHLQLTLIEKVVPLVDKSENKYYSPWKEENRTVEGVLHALYVFRVLDSFFGKIINLDVLSMADEEFLYHRKQTIISQITKIHDFANC